MTRNQRVFITEFLMEAIPQALLLSVEEALNVGAQRAYTQAKGAHRGHVRHLLGQLRHFRMNEGFHSALSANGASPTPINGNDVITGVAGNLTLARFNAGEGAWDRGRTSSIRRELSRINQHIEGLLQPGLFDPKPEPTRGAVFFVSCFAKGAGEELKTPRTTYIALPDQRMQGWLFSEPLKQFMDRYDAVHLVQRDHAKPRLRNTASQSRSGTEK